MDKHDEHDMKEGKLCIVAFLTEAFWYLIAYFDICHVQQHAAAGSAELLRVRRGVHLHHLRPAGHSLRGLVQSR